jgi:hypothetical protein
MLKKLIKGAQKLVGDILPGDTEKYLGTIVGLATGNPLLAAGAGYLGGGTSGAISGALSGYTSPGIKGLGGGLQGFGSFGKEGIMSTLTGANKMGGATGFTDFFLGKASQAGSAGVPQLGYEAIAPKAATQGILGAGGKFGAGFDRGTGEVLDKMGFGTKAALAGLGTITLSQLMGEEEDEQIEEPSYVQTTETLGGSGPYAYSRPEIFYPGAPQKRGELTYDYGTIPYYAAAGGTPEFPRENGIGAIEGPGTETSDSIPAMLSDGEFVMNAKAVKGAGYAAGARDDYEARRLGAQKMYETMDNLEAVA